MLYSRRRGGLGLGSGVRPSPSIDGRRLVSVFSIIQLVFCWSPRLGTGHVAAIARDSKRGFRNFVAASVWCWEESFSGEALTVASRLVTFHAVAVQSLPRSCFRQGVVPPVLLKLFK